MTSSEILEKIHLKHLVMSVENSEDKLLMTDAKPPVVHRYRFPQCVLACSPVTDALILRDANSRRLEQFSPHSNPVGMQLSVGDITVKRD